MFYSHQCSYCNKIFYTFNDSKYNAAGILYNGIKQHLQQYGEDDKEHKFDDLPSVDTDEVYKEMTEANAAPAGGYQIE